MGTSSRRWRGASTPSSRRSYTVGRPKFHFHTGDKDAMYAGSDLKATVSNSNKGKFAKKSKVAAAPAEEEGDAVI